MIEAIVILGGLGVVVGALLAFASRIFYVYVDPKIVAVEEALPGANCGGCGLPGCSANAEAIVAGKASATSCVAGGTDLAFEIAKIMGVTVEAKEPEIARPGCTYGVDDADLKYRYNGVNDCRAAALMYGGMKVCTVGCLGLGSCARACPFGAIQMGPDNLPQVDESRCTGCGTCERVCPKHIINLSSVTRRIIREYTLEECTTPCQRACPAGINIRDYIEQIAAGDYLRAVQIIKERNPFPTVIGRICPRPCEDDCRRQYVDEPVAINFLKRFAADYEKQLGKRILPYKAPETGKRLAVIGGGVEGLSTAFFSARLGHSATVYEATLRLGGLLKSAIAAYRLPDEILQWDIEGVLEMGVNAQTGQVFGRDFSIASLLTEGYEAVFLAAGGWDSRLARQRETGTEAGPVPGVPGMYLLLELLNQKKEIACSDDVVIAGGGGLALEAARLCKERGAKQVTLLFREEAESASIPKEEIDKLDSEGITAQFNAGITRIFGEGDSLTGLDWANTKTHEVKTLPARNIILAAGRFPQLIFMQPKSDTEEAAPDPQSPVQWEAIEAYKQPSEVDEVGWFSKGDAFTDFAAAVRAIGAGRRAAASIHQAIYGITPALPENVVNNESLIQNVSQVESVRPALRQLMPLETPANGDLSEAAEVGFSEEMARAEADRCLHCGLICYVHTASASEPMKATAGTPG